MSDASFWSKQSVEAQLFRFVLVGGAVFLADLLSFLTAFSSLGFHYIWANSFGKVVGAGIGFLLHRRFTFTWNQNHPITVQFTSYVGLFLANLGLANLLLVGGVTHMALPPVVGKLLSDVAVIVFSFGVSRAWVFRRS